MVFRSIAPVATLAALSLVVGGCINDDAAVFVEGSIDSASVSIGQETLGTSVNGGFQLELHLGPRAADPSEVSLGAFRLLSASGDSLLSPLPVASETAFPVTVGVDDTQRIAFTIDSGTSLLSDAERDAICGASEVQISATLEDSLRNASITASSSSFAVTGCP